MIKHRAILGRGGVSVPMKGWGQVLFFYGGTDTLPQRLCHSLSDRPSVGLEPLEDRWLLSASLSAEFVAVDHGGALPGYKTFDLIADSASDWTGAAMLMTVSQGSIYQDPVGGDTAPNPGFFDAFPTLEFDTYLSANDNAVMVIGGAGDVFGDGLRFDTQELDVSWIDTATDDVGQVHLARITLSDDAAGTWSLKLINAAADIFLSLDVTFSQGQLALTPPPPPPPPPDPVAVDGDFTGDGKADIFWHGTRTGRNAVWQMDGLDFVTETRVRRLRNTDWKLVGTGDLTGDGKNDLLWRNTRDGRNSVWEMDHTTFVRAIALPTLVSQKWQVAGVGDLNNDGDDDILWRNLQNGRNTVWTMNQTTMVQAVALPSLKNVNWASAGIADLTGDGKDDILWRHVKKGQNVVWEMDGGDLVQTHRLKRVRNTAWQIAALADYTGDGVTDILWRNTTTGANTVWEMNHTSLVGGLALPAQLDLDDQPASPVLGLWEA